MAAGKQFAARLAPGDVIALHGNVGVGKTVFTRGIVEGIGSEEEVFVASPSYVIVSEYETFIPVFHLDLYRLDESSLEEMALHEYMDHRHITIIEWAPKALYLPADHWRVVLDWVDENKRTIEISRDDNQINQTVQE